MRPSGRDPTATPPDHSPTHRARIKPSYIDATKQVLRAHREHNPPPRSTTLNHADVYHLHINVHNNKTRRFSCTGCAHKPDDPPRPHQIRDASAYHATTMTNSKAMNIWLDRDEALRAIQHLSEDDLRFLNAQIVERLKLLAQAQSTVQLARFNLGDRVSFPGPAGKTIHGTIIKLNKKTAGVQTNDGQQWNVAPSLLNPEHD